MLNKMGDKYVSVSDFYAGKCVFVTGGAGFLGKVLIEKLLFSCPRVEKVYVLLRDKRNISAEQRLKNMLKLPVFSRLKACRPHDLDKLIVVKGDITSPNLNISDADLKILTEQVSIVIHSAASIKFNDPLDVALSINYEGTKNLINFCHLLKNIKSFLYMSTAYSNTDRTEIEEVIYPPPTSAEVAYNFARQPHIDDEDLSRFLNGRPNTYTYTKAMAENLVATTHDEIPAVIIRPSIVTPTIKEPMKGWVDNWFGATALATAVAKGICRILYADEMCNIDLIPVDYVCNLTLVAATKADKNNVQVFNSCTSDENPITIRKFLDLFITESAKNDFNVLPFPHLIKMTKQRWLLKLVTMLLYFVAYAVDFFDMIFFRKPTLVKDLSQSVTIRDLLEYFGTHSWTMRTSKTVQLYCTLSPGDKIQFPFHPKHINWEEYIPNYFQGVSKYLIKKSDFKN